MNTKTILQLEKLIQEYKTVMTVMEHDAARAMEDDGRAYGGFIRAAKGKMQEYITEQIIRIAWGVELEQNPSRLEINSKKIPIPINIEYVRSLPLPEVRNHILNNIEIYSYGLSVDKHVFLDEQFILGIECKAYTENAMIKRILVDFYLLKTKYHNLHCFLFQLESQLGGDYSCEINTPLGSKSTHSLMSYFPNVKLDIFTLLPGERNINEPINKTAFFKPLTIERLEPALNGVASVLKNYSK
jgi:hypothetical protein